MSGAGGRPTGETWRWIDASMRVGFWTKVEEAERYKFESYLGVLVDTAKEMQSNNWPKIGLRLSNETLQVVG